MAIATSTMLAMATVGLVASSAVGALGAVGEGTAEKDRSDFQAADQIQQAAREREISKAEEADFRRAASRTFADSRTASGGSGVQINTGSNLIAAGDFAAEVELQALKIRSGGATKSQRLITQAGLTQQAGKNAQTRGFFRAGSSLLSGASKAFSVNT